MMAAQCDDSKTDELSKQKIRETNGKRKAIDSSFSVLQLGISNTLMINYFLVGDKQSKLGSVS